MTPAERVGRNIRRIRRARDLSQEALAERTGLHRTQFSLWEWGQRKILLDSLLRIAGALGVTPDDLMEGVTWDPVRSEFVVDEP